MPARDIFWRITTREIIIRIYLHIHIAYIMHYYHETMQTSGRGDCGRWLHSGCHINWCCLKVNATCQFCDLQLQRASLVNLSYRKSLNATRKHWLNFPRLNKYWVSFKVQTNSRAKMSQIPSPWAEAYYSFPNQSVPICRAQDIQKKSFQIYPLKIGAIKGNGGAEWGHLAWKNGQHYGFEIILHSNLLTSLGSFNIKCSTINR